MSAAPFSRKSALALVVFGAAVFIILLWLIGAGAATGGTDNGGAHAGGKGLNGHAALVRYLERRSIPVTLSRSAAGLRQPGLLVLTPPHDADPEDVAQVIANRRRIGPTILVSPKWIAAPSAARSGWVDLRGAVRPGWAAALDGVRLELAAAATPADATWFAHGRKGRLPAGGAVASGRGEALVPLVMTRGSGRVLAAYVRNGGMYPALERLALDDAGPYGDDERLFPLVLVFEPDLMDNFGMTDPANARLAETIVRAAAAGTAGGVAFDLTFNGLGRSANLLTLAFTPPFLAATLCLLLAALAAGWRAFLRFGPPLAEGRAIAFGKRALVASSAALVLRSGRLHLVAAPYAALVRERIARLLALPRSDDAAATDAAIDRALASRDAAAPAFSATAARLGHARRPHDILRAARDLHALERILKR